MARRTKVDVEVTDGSSAERFRFSELSINRGALRSAAGLEDFCPLPLIPGKPPAGRLGGRVPAALAAAAPALPQHHSLLHRHAPAGHSIVTPPRDGMIDGSLLKLPLAR